MHNRVASVVFVARVLAACGGDSRDAPHLDESTEFPAADGGAVTLVGGRNNIGDALGRDTQSIGGNTGFGRATTAGGIDAGSDAQASDRARFGGTHTGGAATGGAGVGSASTGTQAAAGTGNPDTTNCAPWPRDKMLPNIGFHFYGPDPGPCESTSTTSTRSVKTTYTYEGVQISSIATPASVKTFRWNQGSLVGYETTSSTATVSGQFDWTSDSVVETASTGMVTKYVFGPTGYPLEAWAATDPTLPLVLVMRYVYSDCRLVQRVALEENGSSVASGTGTIEYDDEGRIVTQRFDRGAVITYDYGCWLRD